MDEALEFGLPGPAQREQLLKLYIDKWVAVGDLAALLTLLLFFVLQRKVASGLGGALAALFTGFWCHLAQQLAALQFFTGPFPPPNPSRTTTVRSPDPSSPTSRSSS